MLSLEGVRSGVFRVFTESGSGYTVDLTGGTLCREVASHPLRGDTVVLALLSVVYCKIGLGAVFVVQLPGVVGPTVRLTSLVTQILVIEDAEVA